jgi:DNA polymerase (family 10)
MMNNRQLAETFTMIADLLEIKGENIYKTLAYRKAADSLLNLGREASEYWKEGKLDDIPGVGKAIAEKIDELLKTGKLEFLEKLKKEVPPGLVEWLPIPGLGPKRAALIWKTLNITTFANSKRRRQANCGLRHGRRPKPLIEASTSRCRADGADSTGARLPARAGVDQ